MTVQKKPRNLEIKCHTSHLLLTAARDVPVMAIPFLVIDTRLKQLACLIEESGTDDMKKKMRLLGYLPD